jgi:4-amino-4-deoxy-L-arabinose transferase-like glycosyltransferase
MIRVIKQYGVSILLLIVAIFCLFNISKSIQDAFTVITNSLALLLAVVYFVNFEKENLVKIKGFVLNIKWPFHGKAKKILTNTLNLIIKKRWDIISYLFLFLLLLITLGQFSYLENFIDLAWINKYQVIITVLTILSGGLTFWHNRDRVEKESEEEQIKEELAEQNRKAEFSKKFPKINKIPILRGFIRWMYKEGFIYLFGLLLILTMFTAIKAPYFNISFTGEHTMKYNTHVEPAKYMNERNDPLWMQRKYLSDPVNNPQGIFNNFGNPPLMEWGLLSTYKLFPENSLEFNTRLFTHLLGIIILILSYFFFKKWFNTKQVLLIIFLLAINPIINLLSFVTVLDSWLLIFTLISLIYINQYISKKNITSLFWAGLFFGIGVSLKMSIFLWLFPIILIILLFNSKAINNFIKNIFIIGFLSLLPLVAHKTSLRYLPSEFFLSLTKFIFWVLIFISLYLILKKYHNKLNNFVNYILKYKFLWILSFIIIIFFSIFFIKFTGLNSLSNEFFTDSTLIFNWHMYDHIFNTQIKKYYLTPFVYYLGLIGFLFTLFFIKKRKQKIVLFSFLFASLLYLILGSKVIFFHNYYTGIIMFTFILGVSILIFNLTKIYKNRFLSLSILILFILLIFPISHNQVRVYLKRERNHPVYLNEVSEFLMNNTNENDIYIDESSLLTLTILTSRARIESSKLINQEIIKSIKRNGFSKAMEDYNIIYLITTGDSPRYERYANLFTDLNLESTSYRRGDIILSRFDSNYNYFSDLEIREKIIEENNIKNKFILEQQVGPFKIFKFND